MKQTDGPQSRTPFRFSAWLIRVIGVIVPQRLWADWKQEWEAELRHGELLLREWDRLNWSTKLDLFRRCLGAFRDALWIQHLRLEDDMFQDLRYGARMLLKHKGFTVVAVISLALGIGANTAIFSLLDAVLLKSLPVREPDKLVLLGPGLSAGISIGFPSESVDLFSNPVYRNLRERNQVFSELAAVQSFPMTVHGIVNRGSSQEREPIDARLISGSYFSMLGVNAIAGRTITTDDDVIPGGHPVAVASYSWWQRRLGGELSALDSTVTIGRTSYTIIGVAPRGFFGTTVGESPDIWVPLSMEEQLPPGFKGLDNYLFQSLNLIGRLKDGVSADQASVELEALFKQVVLERAGQASQEQLTDLEQARIELTPAGRGRSALRDQFSLPLRILMAVVGLVLLIACANLANLLLARATGRQQEFAVRVALGARRGRIVRQLLTESLLVALVGGAAGILVGAWGSHGLVLMVSSGPQPLALDVAPDARVLAFTLVVSLMSALAFGTAPALRASRIELSTMLKERRGASSIRRNLLAKALVASQVAFSLVLLVAAVLFVRTLINLHRIDPGFGGDSVLMFEVDSNSVGLEADSELVGLYREIEERVETIPGVRAASFSLWAFNQGSWTVPARASESDAAEERMLYNNAVGWRFFEAMETPLLAGRAFGPQDTETSPKVAIINETMAQQFFGESAPLGRRFRWTSDTDASTSGLKATDIEVVGIAKDAKYNDVTETPQPMAFYPYSQNVNYLNFFEVSVSGQPGPIITEVRRAMKEASRDLQIIEATTMAEQVNRSLTQQTLVARLSTFFGLVAMLLACIGLFGVMSYTVARRTNEIGIRMALGAQRRDVLRLVLRDGLLPVVAGQVIGIAAALMVTGVARGLLYNLTPNDPLTIVVATLLLSVVAGIAGYLPARRASRLDPVAALRYE